jgi:glycosyltransferase involved in cell wall biosynthesis
MAARLDDSAPMFSIVIAAYNCAPWQERAVRSAMSGRAGPAEAIVVNDGSTDDSPAVLQALKQAYPALRVLNKPNGGLSSARNHGIAHARGTFIVLLDADDELLPAWIGADALSAADIIRIGVEEVDERGRSVQHTVERGPSPGAQYLAGFFGQTSLYPPRWAYLFRRSFLERHRLAFLDGLLHEDMLFTVEALMHARVVVATPALAYRYIRRAGSIALTADDRRLLARLRSLGIIVHRITALANRHPEVELGWWSLHMLEPARGGACPQPRLGQPQPPAALGAGEDENRLPAALSAVGAISQPRADAVQVAPGRGRVAAATGVVMAALRGTAGAAS